MPLRRPAPLGVHAPTRGGLARGALRYAVGVGAEALQVFVSNPRAWALPEGDPRDDRAFRQGCEAGRLPVFVHAPYLVNLGSPDPATRERSAHALTHVLGRAAAIGARAVVVHAGSAVRAERRDAALGTVRELLLPLLERLPEDGPGLLVEPTAGGGGALVARVEDLGPFFAAVESHPRLGVCLDTCHAQAAGHDLGTAAGVRTTLRLLVRTVGQRRLALVHANDSRDPVGSHRDRHAPVGEGTIGLGPFRELFVHPATSGVPIVVETPGGAAGHRRDLARLRELRSA